MDSIKIYIEYIENGLTLIKEFDINKRYERCYNEYEKNKFFKETNLNLNNSDDFITKILNWCTINDKLFSNEPVKLIKINFYDSNNLDDNYLKCSVIKNFIFNKLDQFNNINNTVNLSYKFMYNNTLYNNDIYMIIDTNYKNNSLIQFINSIFIQISYNECNKQSNKDCLKLEHLDKTKEELNKLIENYNSGIKSFITLYDKNYKELEEKNTQFKVILNQDLNQRFETIDIKIKKMQESTERNNDKITFTVNEMLNKRLIGLPNKQEIENIPKIHKLKKDVSKFEKDIENRTLSIENKLTEFTDFANKSVKDNKNLIEEYQKNNKDTFSKLKSEYTKLTNDLNDHYKELLKIHDKENNNQIVYYQKSIENLSSMNKMLIFMILVCYYIFLFIKYYY